ncbi:hypothetical protein TD95_005299 [Thielaviopsis punctulata]|uniref:CFEM domain-containing protein n=1 Tax=Thielaviopsis punctulata TaxID=72032 RepID=A0A0F4ZHE4_9PEZI|nr:hypothetical protein TD95_005299 [Thielaviopsis punctulata]
MFFSRFFTALAVVAAGAVGVLAQNETAPPGAGMPAAYAMLPNCTVACIMQALPLTNCTAEDTQCTCTDKTFNDAVMGCSLSTCPIADALMGRNISATVCHEPIRNRGQSYSDMTISMLIITALFIAARFAYRIYAHDTITIDDWLSLVAFFASIPGSIINIVLLKPNGMGQDVWRLTIDQISKFFHYFFVIELLYFAHLGLLKTILLFFYLRIFPTPKVRKLLIGTIVFNIIFTITFICLGVFQCSPVNYFWMQWYGKIEGSCPRINSTAWSHASIGVTLDLWMLALPLSQLRHLKMHWKKKLGVASMFVVGTFVTFVSIIRLATLVHFAHTTNPTWDFFETATYSSLEVEVGIICTCMPCMRLILVRFWPRMFGSTQRSRNTSGYIKDQPSRSYKDQSSRGFNRAEAQHTQEEYYGELDTSAIMMSRSFYIETEENKSTNNDTDTDISKSKATVKENEVV